jgi:hypothetical protein
MFTALTPLARGLAMATVLVSLTFAAGRAPAAHAGNFGSGPIVCTVCPTLPQPPSLDVLTLTDKDNTLLIQGQGFSSWGGIDLYVWQSRNSWDDPSFAGTVHSAAHGSALTLQIPVVTTKQGQYCSHPDDIYVVATDDNTHLSSGVRHFVAFPELGCYALKLSPVAVRPSLQSTLNAVTGTIHVWGHHYTPHTSVAVYLLQNGMSMPASYPTTLAAKGAHFATTLSTGHLGCSNTLSWTMYALDQTANVASPLHRDQDPCYVPK